MKGCVPLAPRGTLSTEKIVNSDKRDKQLVSEQTWYSRSMLVDNWQFT
jgi:hypothetical protein